MAYPEFDIPMYEPLSKPTRKASCRTSHLVEPDSVTLLETNQRFIESYMVGLNHEFARELLWREYPTDQRGSYFRQFWDVRKKIAEVPNSPRPRRRPARSSRTSSRCTGGRGPTTWATTTTARKAPSPRRNWCWSIRGELLKKYPNTIISAQPAKWQLTNGKPDKSKERQLDESVKPIFPLYEARVEPDIYFFGFDLTAEKARGDDTVDDKPGLVLPDRGGAGRRPLRLRHLARPGHDQRLERPGVGRRRTRLADGKHLKVADDPAAHLGRADRQR